ncbi:MAG: galactokinase [Gemmatimonadota bacterium]
MSVYPLDPLDPFRDRFRANPTHRVRAPGRVNLIGEHVDYVGLPVMPVALDRQVTLHLAPRDDDVVHVVNVDPSFGERRFRLDADPEPGPPGDWVNYLLAAARDRVRAHGPLLGFDAVLSSDVPVAAGLSSSAALVVAAALALDAANGVDTPRLELAEALARAERFVGTRGGGMDQAVCLCARAGHAALIDFGPLRVTHVPIPPGWRFIVADSLSKAEKSGSARDAYNDRTHACADALEAVRKTLGEGRKTGYPELLRSHGAGALVEIGAGSLEGTLLRRFRHVVTEGARVAAAREALERNDLPGFGALMDASHASLRDDYDVSTPDLDRLVELAREAGADGARLTGAGFGGCVVAVCRDGKTASVMETLEREYYGARGGPAPPRDRLFAVRPSAAASVLTDPA